MHTVNANGAEIPALGFGTFELSAADARRMVEHALQCGYRHIDTAQMYRNERAVGEAIQASGVPRESIFLTTKVWVDRFADGDLQASVHESLTRLGTHYVDLLLLHWPNDDVPLAETLGALNDVKRQGLTRHIGVSNFTVDLTERARELSEAPLATNQVEYHPYIDQQPVYRAVTSNDMALTAYCPLAQGRVFDEPTLQTMAQAHGKTAGQVALRWLVQQPGVIAIPRSRSEAHAEANLAVEDFALSDEEMRRIHGLARDDGRIISPANLAPDWDTAA